MTKAPTLAHVIKTAIDNRLLDMHTALIARVEKYDAQKQIVDVAPVLRRSLTNIDGKMVYEDLPLLCDVPVLFPRAGGYFISFPIKPGDFVQLIFNEVDIEQWFLESEPSIAHDERFTLQGAVALPGIFPQSMALKDAHNTNFVLGQEQGLQIHIDGKNIRLGSKEAHEALAIASKVRRELDSIKAAFNKHSHISGAGPIKPSDAITISYDIATTKVTAL